MKRSAYLTTENRQFLATARNQLLDSNRFHPPRTPFGAMGDTVSSIGEPRPALGPGSDIGAYRIVQLLGAGGMGQVFLAEHRKLGRRVALKLLLPEFAGNPEIVRRFFQEARAVNQINHEHIVEIVDFVEEPGGFNYFIMEFLEGKDLSQAREASGSIPLRRSIDIVEQVCMALAATHAKGIVHRDLKPENIFLIRRNGKDDFVKLLDFGVAKLSAGEDLGDRPQTRVGMILGTPEYMSPEQSEGGNVDQRSDLYSVGVLLYWLLSGELPYRAKSFGELAVKRLTTPPTALPKTTPGGERIPPELMQLVSTLMERAPEDRVQTAALLLGLLHEIGETLVATLGVASRPSRLPRLLLAAGVLAVLVGGTWWWLAARPPDLTAAPPRPAAPVAVAPAPTLPEPPTPPVVHDVVPVPPAPALQPATAKSPSRSPSRPAPKRPGTKKPARSDDGSGMIDPFAN
jgi:eukaryotic-like serine/threonine-protein kinase